MRLDGIHTALVTPFDSDGNVDETAMRRLVDKQLSAGIAGFVVGGGTGEGGQLTSDEWTRVLLNVLETCGDRVPVTAHVSSPATAAAVRNTEVARDAGASIAMLHPPFGQELTESEIADHFSAVAAVGLPVMIYNNLAMGTSLAETTVALLAQIPGVQFLKDSSADASRMATITRLTGGTLQIALGKDSLALFGFLSGSTVAVLGSSNATPLAAIRLLELVGRGHVTQARELWNAVGPLVGFFESNNYVAAVKAATALDGIPVGSPRLPIAPLASEKRRELALLLAAVDAALDLRSDH